MNFNQKFEPKENKILHGAGQSPKAFLSYWNAIGDNKPLIYMTYAKITIIQKWIEDIKIKSKRHPNLMLQIGLKLQDVAGVDKTTNVLNGEYDKDFDNFFEIIKELGNPTFIRIGYEFDKKDKYNAKNFVGAWKYIVDKFRDAGVSNIATVWCACPMRVTKPVEQYYPGDEYVDWFGVDVFSAGHFDKEYEPVEDFLKLAIKHKKPVMVGETTAAGVGVLDGEKSWEAWFKLFFEWIERHEQVKAFCYIDWNWAIDYPKGVPGTWGNCRIEENKIVREKFIEELKNPKYIHNQSMTELFEKINS